MNEPRARGRSWPPTLSEVSIALAMLVGGAMREPAAADGPPPNIVLVIADDLGLNDLGCYGRAEHRTPNLDRLASDGIRFTSASAAQPISSPSRAALLTGKCPARLNLTDDPPGRPDTPAQKLLQPRIESFLALEEVTLAELFKQAGYATGLFGKWHLGGAEHSPERQGFDVVESPPANTLSSEKFIEANRDRPFFCYVPYDDQPIPLSASPDVVEKNRDGLNPTNAATIETLDRAVGRLLSKIESLGLADRTIVVFTSANGGPHVPESSGTPATHNAPFRTGKGFLHEGGLRVPLLVRWPGVVGSGRVCDTPVVITDLAPTLLEAARIDPAKAVGPLDGVSLSGLFRGEEPPDRRLCWHVPHSTNQGGRPAGAIRDGHWKLIEQFEDGSLELYDLAADVGETRNLAAAQPARAESMLAQLKGWRARVGARMPTPNPDYDAAWRRRQNVEQAPSRLMPAATGDIRLHAKDARVHGEKLRYEPEPHKNVLGYWTRQTDWAEWEFDVPKPGRYELEIQQGCGTGSGGAEVAIEVRGENGGETLTFTVQETGHFQHQILRVIGEVNLAAGRHTLAVKPRTKPGIAVMDLRRIVLRP